MEPQTHMSCMCTHFENTCATGTGFRGATDNSYNVGHLVSAFVDVFFSFLHFVAVFLAFSQCLEHALDRGGCRGVVHAPPCSPSHIFSV